MGPLNLVPVSEATTSAVKSGNWGEVETWSNGVPSSGAKVYIPKDKTVWLDGEYNEDILWIRVDGRLTNKKDTECSLRVNTIITGPLSLVDFGTADNPASVTITFTEGGFLPGDWQQVSKGLITLGSVDFQGEEKQPYLYLKEQVNKGDSYLVLTEEASTWKVWDKVVVPATHVHDDGGFTLENEVRYITHVEDNVVHLDSPLEYDHFGCETIPTNLIQVINLTRSITLKSESTELEKRGHVMHMSPSIMGDLEFSSHPDLDRRYVAYVDLGRTDKQQPVTDPRKDENGNLVPGSDVNPRARYSTHEHLICADVSTPGIRSLLSDSFWRSAYYNGCAIDGSPGWGLVNHVSNVEVKNCVGYNVAGSVFATEEGNELGYFDGCVAVGAYKTTNEFLARSGREDIADWGINGHGFWSHAPLVAIDNCSAFGCTGAGFAILGRPFAQNNIVKDHLKLSVIIPEYFVPEDLKFAINKEFHKTPEGLKYALRGPIRDGAIDSHILPFRKVTKFLAAACGNLQFWGPLKSWVSVKSRFTGLKVLRPRGRAVDFAYPSNFELKDIVAWGDVADGVTFKPVNAAPCLTLREQNVVVSNFDLRGFREAFHIPQNGWQKFTGGHVSHMIGSCLELMGAEHQTLFLDMSSVYVADDINNVVVFRGIRKRYRSYVAIRGIWGDNKLRRQFQFYSDNPVYDEDRNLVEDTQDLQRGLYQTQLMTLSVEY